MRLIKSRRMRWAGNVARMGEERGVYRVLVGKPEGKRPMGRPRRRWVDNIRMDLQEVGCGYVDWIGLAQDRDSWRTFVSAVMNLRVPWNAGNFLTSCKPVSCSGRTLHHGVSNGNIRQVIVNRERVLIIVRDGNSSNGVKTFIQEPKNRRREGSTVWAMIISIIRYKA